MALTTVLGLLLLGQSSFGQPKPATVTAPPPGSRSEFQDRCRLVRVALSEGKFEQAQAALANLPARNVTFGWADSAVPEGERAAFAEFRDLAIAATSASIRGVTVKAGTPADLTFEFVSERQGTEFETSPTSRLKVLIGLRRAGSSESINKTDAYLAVARAIGIYFGVPENPLPGTAMSSAHSTGEVFGLSRPEQTIIINNLRYVEQLRQWIAAKRLVPFSEPKADLLTTEADLGDILQGASPRLVLKLKNSGNSALDYRLTPDCNCFSAVPPGSVPPGSEAQLITDIRTLEFVGIQSKRLLLYTNDPKQPVREIPVKFRVVPAFRLYRPDGENVVVSDAGGSFDVYLIPATGTDLKPLELDFLGVTGKVSMSLWTGEIPDYVMREPKKLRKGYRISVKISGSVPPGRPTGQIQIKTNSIQFPNISYTLYVQKGIVALPDQIFLGDVVGAQEAFTMVTRPQLPFTITKITSDNPNVSASFTDLKGGYDYRIKIRHDGKGPRGDLVATLRVFTNDPKQAPIEIGVSGYVK